MARKSSSNQNIQLHYVDFTDTEKTEYSSWIIANSMELGDILSRLVEEECKVTISLDQNNGSSRVSLTPKKRKSPLVGHCFLFRHNDLDKCVRIALFYYTEVLDNGNEAIGIDTGLDW